ncbi:MAG: glutaconyl-CoA/methylmalonyl-CoA decarboxylase subunit delta [Chloroflexota bacterium]|nr:glutaconyl-CoA/methylmalonyl-CoA decarboxylase subunit delta [Chloroflexota bacterium]
MDDLLFGLRTAVLGMAIVFSVLAIVWALLTVLMKLDARTAAKAAARRAVATTVSPAAGTVPVPGTVPAVRLVGADDLEPKLVAAITVAILRHEEARRLQAAPAMRTYWPGSLLFASRWVAAGRTRQGQSWRRRR